MAVPKKGGSPPLRRLETRNFSKGDIAKIVEKLGLQVGKPIDSRQVEKGIRELYDQGIVYSIFVRVKAERKGVVVVLEGVPLRRIRRINFSNVDEDIVDQMKERLAEHQRQGSDIRVLTDLRERLKLAYEARGYYSATIQIIQHDVPKSNQVDVDIVVEPNEAVRVSGVNIIGGTEEQNKEVAQQVNLRVGSLYSKEALDDSVLSVNKYLRVNQFLTSRVEQTTLDFNEDQSAVQVNMLVKFGEKFRFEISGNKVFETVQIRELMTDEILSQSDATRRITDLIEEKYKSVGMHFCKVESEVVRISADQLNIIRLHIEEGPRVVVDRVHFVGNYDLEEGELSKIFFEGAPGILKRQVYWEQALGQAVQNFIVALKKRGHLKNHASLSKTIFSTDKRGVELYIDIEMGIQTKVTDIEIGEDAVFSKADILSVLPYKIGDPVDLEKIEEGREKVIEWYHQHGYVSAKMKQGGGERVLVSTDQTQAVVPLVVDSGSVYFVGDISIEGNNKTKDIVILREISLGTDDVYDPGKVKRAEDDIALLGLFSRVEIVTTDNPNKKYHKDMRVVVREIAPGSGEVGLGGVYETPRFRLKAFSGVGYRNVMGLNHSASVRGEIRLPMDDDEFIPFVEYATVISYRAPYPFELPFTFAAQIGLDSFEIGQTGSGTRVQTKARIEGKIEKKLSSVVTVIYRLYRFERTTTEIREDPSSKKLDVIGSTGPGLIVDFRDDIFNPTKGSRHLLDVEVAHPVLLSKDDIAFIMAISKNAFFVPLPLGFQLSCYAGVGWAHSLFRDKPLPTARLTNDLSLGGRGSIRGFRVGQFSPNENSKDTAFYNARAELGTELFSNLSLVVFADTGQIYPDLKPERRQDGVGFGFRYTTPVGPLAVDFAKGLGPDALDAIQFYFTVGTF